MKHHTIFSASLLALLSLPVQAAEIVITCPPTVQYGITLKSPSPEWRAEAEDSFVANFSDLHIFDATWGAAALTPENGDAPASAKLPLKWNLAGAKNPQVECQFKASDGAPGMGAELKLALPKKTQSCTSQPSDGHSGRELRCTTP